MEEDKPRLILAPRANSGLTEILKTHGDEAWVEPFSDLRDLENDPIPPHAEEMRHTKEYYRIYIYRSRYRAIYRVLYAKRIVLVERVGPRGSVYLKGGYVRW